MAKRSPTGSRSTRKSRPTKTATDSLRAGSRTSGGLGREIDFRLLFENAPGLFLVLKPNTPEFTILGASNAYLRATMTEREKITGRGLFDVFPDNPDDVGATGTSNLRASLGRALATKAPDTMAVQKYDIRRPESEGGGFEERFWSPVNAPVLSNGGDVLYILHRVEDVSEFVRAAMAQTEQSNAMRKKMRGMELEILSRSRELDVANKKLSKRVERGERDLREAEEKLLQAQKMEAIGRLAGGVAHDFNNLLSVIIGYAALALERPTGDEGISADLKEIREAGERAATLTRQLLAFSRKQVMQPAVLEVNNVVSRIEKMLRRLIGEDIRLVTRLSRSAGRVQVDPGQLEQIIVNLVVNARDAMPTGGRLVVETDSVELDDRFADDHAGVRAGPHVCISISDTGSGMDEQTLARIFEPFFTTKALGRGTGLGLSTVYGIVKQSGGAITVQSEPGKGSTFRVFLPATTEGLTEARRPTLSLSTHGSETVLVVEDEPGVGRLVQQVLAGAGYAVLMASGAEQAFSLFERNSGIRLLLSDVVLSGLGGPAIAAALRAKDPKLRVLFMSGYTDDALVDHGVLGTSVELIEKPLHPDRLLQKVREVLDNQEAGHGRR